MYPNSSRAGSSRRTFGCILASSIIAVLLLPIALASDQQSSKSEKERAPEGTAERVYEPGGDVKPPKLVHYVEPAFSPASKEAFVEGTVKISTVVTRDGVATDLQVMSGLNTEEDRTAVDAVKHWKFRPGTKAGEPVNVRVTVEVTFHLL